MKNLQLLIFLFAWSFSFSQMTEGYFQYHIEVEAIDTSLKTKQSVGLLRNSKMELYFTKNKSRMNFVMGKLSKLSVIIDQATGDVLTTNDGIKGKYAMYSKTDDLARTEKDNSIKTVFTKETKTILGFPCKKLILVQNDVKTTYWYTNEIKIEDDFQQISNPNVPGFPMKFSKIDNGVLMTFEISNINEYISNKDEVFSLKPPQGFQVVTTKN